MKILLVLCIALRVTDCSVWRITDETVPEDGGKDGTIPLGVRIVPVEEENGFYDNGQPIQADISDWADENTINQNLTTGFETSSSGNVTMGIAKAGAGENHSGGTDATTAKPEDLTTAKPDETSNARLESTAIDADNAATFALDEPERMVNKDTTTTTEDTATESEGTSAAAEDTIMASTDEITVANESETTTPGTGAATVVPKEEDKTAKPEDTTTEETGETSAATEDTPIASADEKTTATDKPETTTAGTGTTIVPVEDGATAVPEDTTPEEAAETSVATEDTSTASTEEKITIATEEPQTTTLAKGAEPVKDNATAVPEHTTTEDTAATEDTNVNKGDAEGTTLESDQFNAEETTTAGNGTTAAPENTTRLETEKTTVEGATMMSGDEATAANDEISTANPGDSEAGIADPTEIADPEMTTESVEDAATTDGNSSLEEVTTPRDEPLEEAAGSNVGGTANSMEENTTEYTIPASLNGTNQAESSETDDVKIVPMNNDNNDPWYYNYWVQLLRNGWYTFTK